MSSLRFWITKNQPLRTSLIVQYFSIHYITLSTKNWQSKQFNKALKPSGICIAVEPGEHHATQLASVEAMEKFNVTEKDMPPYRIIALAEEIGFREFKVLPPPDE